ncbi:hypothetical protein GCU85_08280 [Cardiobacteriales bacterium ML27]|uniref:Uncharacterized protein n=1 Tax=Ostreibacterium oceani TaxID=2654998 RepID=A0A6N7EYT6_9GAMM|nr:hypothetical protein [Ostreibacterium oceani]
MVIRQSEIGYFWGCSAFPNCWHKQRLTAAELAALPE